MTDDIARFKPWMCLACGYTMDAAWGTRDHKAAPVEGDLSVCMNCARPYTLEGETWRPVTAQEVMALSKAEMKELVLAQAAIRWARGRHGDLSKKRGGHA